MTDWDLDYMKKALVFQDAAPGDIEKVQCIRVFTGLIRHTSKMDGFDDESDDNYFKMMINEISRQ